MAEKKKSYSERDDDCDAIKLWTPIFNVGEAILSADYLLNRMIHKNKDVSPYKIFKKEKPCYKTLKVWGCLAKVLIPAPKKEKMGSKTMDCIFIRYNCNNMKCRFLVHESKIPDIQKNTIMESRIASFFETIFPCNPVIQCLKMSKRTHESMDEVRMKKVRIKIWG